MILKAATRSFHRWWERTQGRVAQKILASAVRSFDGTEHEIEIRGVSGVTIPTVRIKINVKVEGRDER